MNDRKKGPQRLLELILRRQVRRLMLTHQDRWLRFGAKRVFARCESQGGEGVIIHQGKRPRFEEDLAQEVLELITVFSARLDGSRSRQYQTLLDALAQETPAPKTATPPLSLR